MGKQSVVATVYDKQGNVVSVGYNSYIKTHPLQAKLACRCGQPEKVYLHAEIAALVKMVYEGTHNEEENNTESEQD